MAIHQLSVFVENRKGRLAGITAALAAAKVDIRAVSIADTTDYGILRLIVNQPGRAMEALKAQGMTVSLTEVIGIAVSDQPGGLAKAVGVLAAAGMDVEYMYAFVNPGEDVAYVILRVEDNQKATEVLTAGGIRVVTGGEVERM